MNDICIFCYDVLNDDNILLLQCGHNTCRYCFLTWSEEQNKILRCGTCRDIISRPFLIRGKAVIPFQKISVPRYLTYIIRYINHLPFIIEYIKCLLFFASVIYIIYLFLQISSICFVPSTQFSTLVSSENSPYCFEPLIIYGKELTLNPTLFGHKLSNEEQFQEIFPDITPRIFRKYIFIASLICCVFISFVCIFMLIHYIFQKFKLNNINDKVVRKFMQKKFNVYY